MTYNDWRWLRANNSRGQLSGNTLVRIGKDAKNIAKLVGNIRQIGRIGTFCARNLLQWVVNCSSFVTDT